ncbi:MAG: hypothetical protein C0483_07300 [Pirellula sp.]|nr:hypothetical protein [Pirellula sp.]
MTSAVLAVERETNVGMGQIAVVGRDQVARSVLGSCIGVVLYDERRCLGAFAHVVLPASGGRAGSPGKFADTAVPFMLEALRKAGADPKSVLAKITGGSNMFSADGPFQIGKQNADAVRAQFKAANIRLVAEHLGGTSGRRVTFHPDTALLEIECVGQQVVVI